MLGMQAFLLILACLLILQLLKQNWPRSRSYPPGPVSLPFIGGLWKIGFRFTHDTLSKMAAQYGNIYSIEIGSQDAIGVSGYHAVKEVLINHSGQIAGRPLIHFLNSVRKGNGIVFSSGQLWKQQRKLWLTAMRKLGLGKSCMEQQVQEEADRLVEALACAKGQPVDPLLMIRGSITKLICALLFGYQFLLHDEDVLKLVEALETLVHFGSTLAHQLYESFPWLMNHLPGPHQPAIASMKTLLSFARKEIEKHKEQQDLHEPQDFIDFYLLCMEKSKNDPSSTYNEENLAECILDLLIAGSDTTTIILQSALSPIATHPDIQAKVHKEIDDVLGSSQPFSFQDWKKLPYTSAVIHEILRANFILPVGLPRKCMTDMNVLGFSIPKDTYIFMDMESVHKDPEKWEAPKEFYPNHFLDKDGRFVEREGFFPFGAGARVCLGEQLAKIEVFVFFISLMREFTFHLPGGVKESNLKPVLGFTILSDSYKICAVPRCDAA